MLKLIFEILINNIQKPTIGKLSAFEYQEERIEG